MATSAPTLVIQENIPLATYTTYNVGGPAKHFCRVTNRAEVLTLLAQAHAKNWKVFVMASGSNMLVSDRGFDGLVIHMDNKEFKIEGSLVTAGAATDFKTLVDASIEANLAGLEWAGGLPGSFGGAIRGNAGCFGGETKDVVLMVKSIDLESGKETVRDNQACLFGYRDSVFKHAQEVIIEATLQLSSGDGRLLRNSADEHIRYRIEKHPLDFPNAGSVFKNVPLELVPKEHMELFEDAVKNDPFPIVPTAKILAVAGLKGITVGGAQLSEKHSNYIVNTGNATAADILGLIERIRTKIRAMYTIELEIEQELVGF